MKVVEPILPSTDIPNALRAIADEIESGEREVDCVTVIAMPDVFQLGPVDDERAALETVFACQYAINLLMGAAVR